MGSLIKGLSCNQWKNILTNTYFFVFCSTVPSDCTEIYRDSGSYYIYPWRRLGPAVNVFCEFIWPRGWTVIQRRLDGSVNFTRNWTEYKLGFGDANGEYWIGNDILHHLTGQGQYELKIILKDWDNVTKYVEYTTFTVADEADQYNLTVGGYSGDVGDCMYIHNGKMFSTFDRDNDIKDDVSCAQACLGGWWYKECYFANLNGLYYNTSQPVFKSDCYTGIIWGNWHGFDYFLKETTMMLGRK